MEYYTSINMTYMHTCIYVLYTNIWKDAYMHKKASEKI